MLFANASVACTLLDGRCGCQGCSGHVTSHSRGVHGARAQFRNFYKHCAEEDLRAGKSVCSRRGSWGAGGRPLVVAQPSSPTAESFMELGAGLVREVAKMQRQQRNAVRSGSMQPQSCQWRA